jgi:excisionase family DNA binding protein
VKEDEQMLTVDQAADRLQASKETIRRWLRDGKIKGVRIGGKRLGWRIPLSEIRRVLSEG